MCLTNTQKIGATLAGAVLAISLVACGGNANQTIGASDVQNGTDQTDTQGNRVIVLGTSPYTLTVPGAFVEGEMSEDEMAENLKSYYYSEEGSLDFDIYQIAKTDETKDLSAFVDAEVDEYEGTDVVKDESINGISVASYRTQEQEDDEEEPVSTLSYVMDSGNDYIEVIFWLDGEEAETEAKGIISTLAKQ